jgi:hypothetical protein
MGRAEVPGRPHQPAAALRDAGGPADEDENQAGAGAGAPTGRMAIGVAASPPACAWQRVQDGAR